MAFAGTEVRKWKVVPPSVESSTWNSVSSLELSVQVRSIWVSDKVVAMRVEGAVGGNGSVVAQLGLFRPGAPDSISALVTGPSQLVTSFVRTDCNDDSMVDIADPIYLLDFLFVADPPTILGCRDACDANDDGQIDIADPIMILNELFGEAPPLPPFPDCGVDPSDDTLGCGAHMSCP